MNDADGVLLSVRAEARQLVAPDYAVLDGLFEHTAGSKVEAVGSVAASLDRLTADLAALGGVPFDEATGRRLSMLSPPSSSQLLYSVRPPFMLKATLPLMPTVRLVHAGLVAHAGDEGHQSGEVSAVEFELGDFFPRDGAGEFGGLGLDLGDVGAFDDDFSGGGADLEGNIDARFLARHRASRP